MLCAARCSVAGLIVPWLPASQMLTRCTGAVTGQASGIRSSLQYITNALTLLSLYLHFILYHCRFFLSILPFHRHFFIITLRLFRITQTLLITVMLRRMYINTSSCHNTFSSLQRHWFSASFHAPQRASAVQQSSSLLN